MVRASLRGPFFIGCLQPVKMPVYLKNGSIARNNSSVCFKMKKFTVSNSTGHWNDEVLIFCQSTIITDRTPLKLQTALPGRFLFLGFINAAGQPADPSGSLIAHNRLFNGLSNAFPETIRLLVAKWRDLYHQIQSGHWINEVAYFPSIKSSIEAGYF